MTLIVVQRDWGSPAPHPAVKSKSSSIKFLFFVIRARLSTCVQQIRTTKERVFYGPRMGNVASRGPIPETMTLDVAYDIPCEMKIALISINTG